MTTEPLQAEEASPPRREGSVPAAESEICLARRAARRLLPGETNLRFRRHHPDTKKRRTLWSENVTQVALVKGFCRPEEDVPNVQIAEGEDCLNEVTPKRNVEIYIHVVPDLDHCGIAVRERAISPF